jgi:hypothetical protein
MAPLPLRWPAKLRPASDANGSTGFGEPLEAALARVGSATSTHVHGPEADAKRVSHPYRFAWASSQSARLVKPTITASIQYWERTASLASS